MKKIGILGGTFSPIHNGHIELAKNAYSNCDLDEVWFIPSGISYMKRGQNIPDGQTRYDMVLAAIKDYPMFQVSSIEIERKGNTYTKDTLLQLRELYPSYDFYFIIGDDTLFSMETWYCPEEIFSNCTIIVAVRDHLDRSDLIHKKEQLEDIYRAHIILMDSPAYPVSSTEIRTLVKNKQDVTKLLPEAVISFIEEKHLYYGD